MKSLWIRFWAVLLIMMVYVSGAGAAEVTVQATVDRDRIAAGESLQLRVTVTGAEARVDTSVIRDFDVREAGTSSQIQIVNGHMTRQVIYGYMLIPRHEGPLIIPALTAEIDGRQYQTAPITITVAKEADSGTGGRDVFTTAEVSEANPFAGQQVIYTFSLYNAVQVTEARFQPPTFDGFDAREIDGRPTHRQTINGREYAVVDISYVLVPLAAGEAVIEPAVLQVGVVSRERSSRRTPFDDFFDSPFLNRGAVTPRVLRTDPVQVTVKPLPPFQGPGTFSGLVGQFELDAELENIRLQVGDSTTLTMTIKGRGNIMDARSPQPAIPEGFKSYTDAPQETVTLDRKGYSGQKVFRLALVPVKAGKFDLPPVVWTYFDVGQSRYRSLRVDLPSVYVAPGAPADGGPLMVTPAEPGPTKETVAFTGRDILPPKEDLGALQPQRPLSPAVFLLLLLGPGAAFGGLCLFQHLGQRDAGTAARMKAKARMALKNAGKTVADCGADQGEVFLSHLYRALTAAIFAAAGRSGEALTWKEAEDLLVQSGLDVEAARHTARVLADIESAKFSPTGVSPDRAGDMLADVRRLVRRLAP